MEHIVLCPGSRSASLALAAGALAKAGRVKLLSAIDERSAAFLALGIGTATGKATAVVTTSGTAVAELLPAAVEADRSCQPILFLTADRPFRLKNCGANQTVNQEEFLGSVCRGVQQSPRDGLHLIDSSTLYSLVEDSWSKAHECPGPVHINLAFEEPLHATLKEQSDVWTGWSPDIPLHEEYFPFEEIQEFPVDVSGELFKLDPLRPGVVIAGPWRGPSEKLLGFQETLIAWQELSGWPVLADPLSGVSCLQKGLIKNWELLIPSFLPIPQEGLQVLRLGPLPASRTLESWLQTLGPKQLLITEGDFRKLDPLGISVQFSKGFATWWRSGPERDFSNSSSSKEFLATIERWFENDQAAQSFLEKLLPIQGSITEPSLARALNRLLPDGLPVMLAASSPIRDWISFAGASPSIRRCFGFRGASGIDGTLSLGMGLAVALGPTVLVSGDLALLHDSNGWLLAQPKAIPLVVVLIDNGGGGIFKQLAIETSSSEEFAELFAMPQLVDQLALAKAHGIPNRQVSCLEDLEIALEWSFSQKGPVLLRVSTDPVRDSNLRNELRKGVAQLLESISQNTF